jgi:dolichol-phosphate mannosyltransferase
MVMTRDAHPQISIVVPILNEAGAVVSLAREIAAAFADEIVEIIFVDDASIDDAKARLAALKAERPLLRVLAHARTAGQSRALRTGILAARAPIVVLLDGDGQNDPADAPRLVAMLRAGPPSLGLVGGERAVRHDPVAKRWASRLANRIRRRLLDDRTLDTGCGLKALRREAFLHLAYFDHQHRYLPAMMLREGYEVAFLPVSHRPRLRGRSKYTHLGRLLAGSVDMLGVLWLKARTRDPGDISEL